MNIDSSYFQSQYFEILEAWMPFQYSFIHYFIHPFIHLFVGHNFIPISIKQLDYFDQLCVIFIFNTVYTFINRFF